MFTISQVIYWYSFGNILVATIPYSIYLAL